MPGPILSSETIAAAEILAGIEFSRAERELMLDNLDAQIAAAQARRALVLPNDAPVASRFDPRLPDFPPPPPQHPLRASDAEPGRLPDRDEDIAFAPVALLGQWIARGDLGSRRLTEIYLARIAEHAGGLECFITVTAELARAQADAADAMLRAGRRLGPLHGIPYALKDLFDTAGIRTSWGAMPFRERVPDRDARVVEMLGAAGAVLVGKTAVGALAYGDVWFGGKARNPWNREEGSSGSSAGSAAAVAAGLCGFAVGTETLGSITAPSQRCGTTGLRPTFGRVSRTGAMTLCWSLDKVGPMARSVEDCALVLAAINGADPADRFSIGAPFNFDATAGLDRMRLGYLPAAFADPGANAVDHEALNAARGLGIEVVPVSLPDLPYGSLMAILQAEAAACFEELTLSGRDDMLVRQDKGAWPNAFRRARFLSAVDHVQADRLRYRVMQALDGLFREVDALIGPFMTGPMLVASNFTGHPCLHLRAGFIRSATRPDRTLLRGAPAASGEAAPDAPQFEVPQGISLWGRLFDEGRLCNLGMALEAALGVAERRPAPAGP